MTELDGHLARCMYCSSEEISDLYGRARFFEQVLAVFLAEFAVNFTRFSFVCVYFTNILYCFPTNIPPLQLVMFGRIDVLLYNELSFTVVLYTELFRIDDDVESRETS